MNNTCTVKDLISLLWNHLILIILVTFFGGAATFAFSKFVLPLQYSSHITMYVQSYTGISENPLNDVNNISNSKQLVNTYMEVLKDDEVMNAVSDKLMTQYQESELREYFIFDDEGKIAPTALRNCLSVSTVTDTSAVNVVVTTMNAQLSADICNDLTLVAPKYVEEAVGVGSINTIGKAKVYKKPVAPNNIKNTILGMAAAFLIVILIILIIDYFDNTIKESDIISKKYNKAIIGGIQQFDDEKRKSKKHRKSEDVRGLLTDVNTPFNIIESYKTIRANILFTIGTSDKKIIAISSSNPNEGKSTSAANLSITLAQTGSKVLLIDADMRKPVQHNNFKVTNSDGLSTLIIRKSTMDKAIKNDIIQNLDLLTSGSIPPNPSELLASENYKKLLDELSQKYDYIIIDTPPINVVSDAMVMKDSISGILLVIRYASTTYEELSSCMKQIELAQANMLGFVMNDIHHSRSSSYYNYKYKYKYKKYSYSEYGYGYGHTPEQSISTDVKEENKNAD